MVTKKQNQSIPPEFGGTQSTTPELQSQQSFGGGGGGKQAPSGSAPPKPEVTKDTTKEEVPRTGPPRVFRDVKTGRISGVEIGGRTFLGLSPAEAQAIIDDFNQERATPEGAIEASDLSLEQRQALAQQSKQNLPFRQELIQDIQTPPDLIPSPIFEGLFGSLTKSDGTQFTSAELAEMQRRGISPFTPEQEKRRKLMGMSAAVFGLALGLGAAAAPFIATKYAASISAKTVAAKSAYFGGTVVALGGAAFGFGKLTDFERTDISVQKSIIQGIVETGERIEAMNRNGLPSPDTLQDLRGEFDSLERAEQIIKEKGETNLKYRFSNEYMEIMSDTKDARRAIIRRIDAVINTAATGSAQLNPDALMLQAEELLEYAENPLGR